MRETGGCITSRLRWVVDLYLELEGRSLGRHLLLALLEALLEARSKVPDLEDNPFLKLLGAVSLGSLSFSRSGSYLGCLVDNIRDWKSCKCVTDSGDGVVVDREPKIFERLKGGILAWVRWRRGGLAVSWGHGDDGLFSVGLLHCDSWGGGG